MSNKKPTSGLAASVAKMLNRVETKEPTVIWYGELDAFIKNNLPFVMLERWFFGNGPKRIRKKKAKQWLRRVLESEANGADGATDKSSNQLLYYW
jgi:hypothetical protein